MSLFMQSEPVLSILFFIMSRLPPRSTLFPYTSLFRSVVEVVRHGPLDLLVLAANPHHEKEGHHRDVDLRDRKSTRLNSSHTVISYAVFCLKKKKKKYNKHIILSSKYFVRTW